MPEGHTVHRLARAHRRPLRGKPVAACSPQGRFAAGAATLHGRVLREVDAHGKHLFYRWAGEARSRDATLHVHLGLFGRFVTHRGEPPPPSDATRLQLATAGVTLRLSGPSACDLVEPGEEARIRGRLGPDPLRRDADPERARAALARRRVPIGAALLDQSVVAGVGNAFRAEALFACGIDPGRPARSLTRDEFDALWSTLAAMLRDGLREGRIVTVAPGAAGATRRRVGADDGRWVYRRADAPCRRCGTAIRSWQLGGRRIYACPACQAR